MFLILQPVIVFPSPIGEVEVWYVCCFQIGSFAIEGRRDCLELIRGEWGKVREVFALIWKMCQLVASTKTLVMVTILSTTFTINQLTVTPTRLSLITDTQFCFLLHLDIPYLLSFRNTGSSESVFLKVTSKSSIWYRPSKLFEKEECTWSWHLLFFSPARKNATVVRYSLQAVLSILRKNRLKELTVTNALLKTFSVCYHFQFVIVQHILSKFPIF